VLGTARAATPNPQERTPATLRPTQRYVTPAPPRTEYVTLLPAGTRVPIRVETELSSKYAHAGTPWRGAVTRSVNVHGHPAIRGGSSVAGVVALARPARRGSRAALQLRVTSMTVDGRRYRVSGRSTEVIAGSTRARNIGAIAGGTVGGALIGRAVGGSGKGAVVGGVLGGAAAGGAVAASKGYQADIHAGSVMTFVMRALRVPKREPVATRR